MPSVGLRFPDTTSPAVVGSISNPVIGAAASWRRRGSVQTFVGLCWTLGTCATFLAVGVVGMFAADVPWYELKTLEALVEESDLDMMETSMAELQSEAAPAEQMAEEPVELPTEITEPLETPPEVQDLPELVEAMTQEDIFAIPTAPKIEDAMRPVDPVAKPKPRPTPAKPRTTVAKAGGGTGAPTANPGAAGGVAGGTGTSGNGKLVKPDPPYPSFARSAGMQGRASVVVTFGASGRVEGASIVSSTGYSALDSHTTSWIQRNWRWPGTSTRKVRVPISYRLR
ncbi:TonB family protein [Prosthecobacter sp.]